MGKNWMIKDGAGRAIGYIQQTQDALRARIETAVGEKAMYIWFFFSDGTHESSLLNTFGAECEWTMRTSQLCGACVASEGVRIADTGTEARMRFAQVHAAKTGQRDSEPISETQTEEIAPEKTLPEAQCFPEPRWPPPPCWSRAQYVCGTWQENQNV